MNTSDSLALSCYQQVAVLDKEHDVTLVQHSTTGSIYVRKRLSVYNIDVYRYLLDHHIRGIPAIEEIASQDGDLIVIEEYISGRTLQAVLDNGNLFPAADAVRIVSQLCLILREMHLAEPPIIHRDIKPSNIIITPDGSIRLLDMNAARFSAAGKAEDTSLLGTYGYAAPEQFGFGSSNAQTDLYSVGVLLCEMITGHLPKEGLPEGKVGEIIRKCTRIDPEDRYASVDDLLEVLHKFLASTASDDTEIGIHQEIPREISLNPSGEAVLSVPTGVTKSAYTDTTIVHSSVAAAAATSTVNEDTTKDAGSPAPVPKISGPASAPPSGYEAPGPAPVRPNALPGFRTGSPTNMAIAIIGYALLFYIGLTLTASDAASPVFLLMEKAAVILCGLFVVFFTCDYRGMWRLFRINRIRSPKWKTAAIILIDAAAALISVLLTGFAASVAGI